MSSSILNLTTRSPIDGTESTVLATAGANWQATLANILIALPTANSWTATLTPGGGTITATTLYSYYVQIGKAILFFANFNINPDNGTTNLQFNLPFTTEPTVGQAMLIGTSGALSTMAYGICGSNTSTITCRKYDGSYPTVAGGGNDFFTVQGVMRIA